MAIQNVIKRRRRKVILSRPPTKTVVDGFAVSGTAVVNLDFLAVVQPLQPKEIRNLPPGQNATDWRNFWSLEEIQLKDVITAPNGFQYTIQNSIYWDEGEFWQAQGSKVHDTL